MQQVECSHEHERACLGRHAFHDARTNLRKAQLKTIILLRKTQTKTIFAAKNTAQNHFCCEKRDKTKTKTMFSTFHVIFAGWNAHNFSFPSP
jgi:hypothetical protein